MISLGEDHHPGRSIVICHNCDGTGRIPNEHRLDRDDPEKFTCSLCCGSGRLQKEVTITYKPYLPLFNDTRSTGSYIELDKPEEEKKY